MATIASARENTVTSELCHCFMPIPRPSDDPRNKRRLENTYMLEPPAGGFRYWRVQETVEARLTERLAGVTYDPDTCKQLAIDIADSLQQDMVNEGLERYKFACQVVLCERVDQAMAVGFRCLWDHTRDNFATATFENQTIIAVCTVFAIYYE